MGESKTANNERKEHENNMSKTYRIKNRGLDIKISSMKILFKRLEELDELANIQVGKEKMETLAVMSELGKAIIPD